METSNAKKVIQRSNVALAAINPEIVTTMAIAVKSITK